ncbi:MAG: 16S rRNA (guanine(966)-N(2))-methyltransferase RsmD [Acidimicrobiales bacterium mtb01]|nr:16S rRNA (guanine(966)-N(2))-methyltransferase RsmD [Actinomycetota bacterium]TEX45570.1 MAG: 16S rRNA (guanine(966)-N(2))-methyltransferase RsmD [Acidimicrobiales bacterium mtb01]
MRVVAGSLRGRAIIAPEGDATRPTTDRAREAMFNALDSLGVLDDAAVLDVYAGSGALGIEALSRGARHCTFIERDKRALEAIRANVSKLGLVDRTRVVAGDTLTSVVGQRNIDLLLADPPYGFSDWDRFFTAIEPVVVDDAVVVVESDREPVERDGWEVVRSKRYGRAWVTFLRPNRPA